MSESDFSPHFSRTYARWQEVLDPDRKLVGKCQVRRYCILIRRGVAWVILGLRALRFSYKDKLRESHRPRAPGWPGLLLHRQHWEGCVAKAGPEG